MFSAPTKDKTTLFTMFSFSRNPKIEPKHRYLRCFCNTKKSQRSQNTAICDTLATQHVRNAVFYSVFGTPFQKHWYLQCFVKTHARNTVNTNEFKDYIFHGNKPQTAKTLLFTAFLRNDFSKKNVLFGPFLASETSQDKEGGYPPPPFHILNFKIFTKSKTWQFLELETRPEPHFLTVFTMFSARAQIFTKKMQRQKLSKKSLKNQFPAGVLVF